MMRYHHDFGNLWKEENIENALLKIGKQTMRNPAMVWFIIFFPMF